MNLLIFEGISGSGKTTLFHPIHKLSNYADLHIHRFTPTNWVYDQLYNRRNMFYEELNVNLQNLIPTYVLWCDCQPQIALERQISKKDLMIEDLKKARDLFHEYFTKITQFKNVLYLPTDVLTIEECVEKVKGFIYNK